MFSAVSAEVSATQAVSFHWFKMPELSRATHRLLGKSGAGWTFETICRLLHHVGRVGRPQAKQAAKDLGRLGVGLQAIADEAGVSVAKVRRDLVKLVDLGLVAVSRRNVTFSTDPATGKIVENRTGRSLPVTVFLSVGPEHCRTKAGQDRPGNPVKTASPHPVTVDGPGLHDRDHSGGAIQRERNTKRTPVGLAAGVGQPQAAQEAGLAAGKAGQAGDTVRQDAKHDDLPPAIGRICRPAGKAACAKPKGQRPLPEDHREPLAFAGKAADAFAATQKRLAAEQAAREAEDARWRQEAEQAAREASNGHYDKDDDGFYDMEV
jgi:hypothetical protein